MSTWTIVPVKSFARAKSRLSGVLSSAEREALSRSLLSHTLDILEQVYEISRVLVISHDTGVLAFARRLKVQTVMEAAGANLNTALHYATNVARSFGCDAVLVLPSDLPLLEAADVQAVLQPQASTSLVVISPDRHYQGTNALLTSPPGVITYQFGPNSFTAHLGRANEAHIPVQVCRRPNLALDLDTPEDLELCRDRLRL